MDHESVWQIVDKIKIYGVMCSPDFGKLIVSNEDKIQYYKIDSETGKPELNGLCQNFMASNHYIQGKEGKVVITFMRGQEDFIIFRRKNFHNFMATVNSVRISFCSSLSLDKFFYISRNDNINVFCSKTFK
jgi:hypothetical protein